MARGYDVSITITTQWREGGKPPSPQHIEKIKKPIRDLNTEIRKQQGLLSKLYNNWKSTFAVFAAGYATVVLFLSVMRALKDEFFLGFKAIEEYRQSVISLSATTMMFMKTTGDLSKDWEAAVGYAKQLAQKAEELDVIFTGTAKELLLAARALTTMGIQIDTSNKKQLQSWVALAEAAKAVTTGANKEFQIRQEIQALLEGQTRQGATLARILDRQLRTVEGYKGGLKEALEIWKANETVLEELSKRLQGFKQAQKDIRDLISTQWATLSTINRRVLRQGFLPAYHEINELLKKQVDYYTDTEHGLDRQRDLANRIALTWIKVNAALKVGYFLLTATIDLVDKFWFKEGRWQRIKEKATEFAGGLAIIFMKMLGKSEEEIIKFVEDTEATLGRMPKTTQGATKEHLSYIEQLVSDAKKFWTDLYDTYVKLGVAAYQRDLANLQNTEKERIELLKKKQQEQEEGTKKEISNIQKIRDAYNALLMDYERYESQRKEISQEMATERLRIEAKLTGSLEDEYKYRMKQVEEWETQKLNRVLSINSAMWRKIISEENRIRAQAAKEGRTTIEQLYLDELYKLDELAGMKIQILKSTAEKEIEIRKTAAEKQKEIFRDIYTYSIDLAQTFQNTISDAFEGIVLGTRKLSDVFKAMRDALVREFATGLAGMITKKIEWEKTLIGNLEINLPKAFGSPLEKIKSIWSSAMDWLKGSTGKLLGTLGTTAYGIAGIVGGEPWRAIGGAGATAALFTGHPVIAMATITAAEIGRAIFKGRVEWVGVGAGAAGIPTTQIGLRGGMGFWQQQVLAGIGGAAGGAAASMLGLGMMAGGVLGAAVGGLVTLFTSMFSRKWPTIRGTAELSLKGLSDSLDYVEGYMREIEKYLDEHTEIYAMYKTRFARVTVIEKRDVKGSMDKITQTFGSFVDDLIDFYQSILPSTMRFEELPSIEMTFGAGKKNMENLAKQFVNELVSQTYNAWAVPIMEEYNRLLGMDLFEKFGLPKIGELVGGIGHHWNEQMKKLYERLSREVLPSLGVAFTYAKTIMNLMDKYGEGLVSVYKDEIANELVNMLERYKGEVQGLKEKEVKKKAEEFGQTVNEYLSTVVSIIGEIEDVIAQYTLSSFEQNLREIRSWYQEKLAELTSLGLSTERLLLAVTLKIKNLIEQSIIAPLKSLYASIQQFRLPEPAFVSWQVTQLETKWGPIWGDIDALAGRWDELIADASTYFSLLQRQFEFEAQAIRARAEERKAQIRAEAEAQRAVMQERLNGIQEEISALQEQKRELEGIKEQWKGVIDSIKQRLQELQFGPEAPVQSWAAYQVKWAELVKAAKSSPEAAQELIEFSKRYLEVAKIYAPSQYLDIWQQVVSTLQDVEDNAVSEIDLLQTQIDAIERQTEELRSRTREIERLINTVGSNLSARLAAIDAQAEQQITLLRQEYANRMMAIHDRLREVGEYLAKQIEEQMPEDIRLLTATANWLEKIYNYLTTGVPSAQTGGVTTREGLYHLHAGETILPRNTNIKVEIDSDKLGKSIASSLLSAGITSGSSSQSIHLHIDGREIATVTAEQMRRGHSELIKQVRRVSH